MPTDTDSSKRPNVDRSSMPWSGNALLMPSAGSRSVLPKDEIANDQPEPMSPGDDAPIGTPGTGENVCPHCGGSGHHGSEPCPVCGGTGKVNVGVGGG